MSKLRKFRLAVLYLKVAHAAPRLPQIWPQIWVFPSFLATNFFSALQFSRPVVV